MSQFNIIENKLKGFIKKYYTNELIKGVILFITIGLLYLIFTLFVEQILWLNTLFRTFLFWLVVFVEIGLFVKFIAIPLYYLFNLHKGLDFETASSIIGNHFPEVSDKLLNVLQLNNSDYKDELLIASINQKSGELSPVPFKLAIDFNKNKKYIKYLAIPLIILLLAFSLGKWDNFTSSYNRVVNYDVAFEAPAPFTFSISNNNLKAIQGQDFSLIVNTSGKVIPDNVTINFNNENYLLNNRGVGVWEYTFSQIQEPIEFTLNSNGFSSRPYIIKVLNTPTILGFNMHLDYPNYIGKPNETLTSIGNAIIPKGTKVTWKVSTKSTTELNFISKDSIAFSLDNPNSFILSKTILSDTDYTISTNNTVLKAYENLAFNLKVIKDVPPEIQIEHKVDTVDLQSLYFKGKATDDYGLSKIELVYYPEGSLQKEIKIISNPKSNITDFITAFPANLNIVPGKPYELYFKVYDNDGFKTNSTKSEIFYYKKRTASQEELKRLQSQNSAIKSLSKSVKSFKKERDKLNTLRKTQKEKQKLSFNDKQKVDQFIKKQQEQKDLFKSFNKKFQDELSKDKKSNKKQDEFTKDLKKRIKQNDAALKKQEKLLEEIQKLKDKFNKEQFSEKLQELEKKSKSQERSLEQILELTKRYYITKKLEKISKELDALAKRQDALSKKDTILNTVLEQQKLNSQFQDIIKDLDELSKENKSLRSPIKMPRNKSIELTAKEEQSKATNNLNKSKEDSNSKSFSKAQQHQKNASTQIKKMSLKMQSTSQKNQEEQLQADAKMLRQILDNLLLFSFSQEDNMNSFKSINVNHNEYSKYLKNQNNLKNHFSHVDDSLFVLSLRQPKIGELINKEINDVYFNIDKSLSLFVDNFLSRGIAKQQYTITASNNLANMLSKALEQMENQMMKMSQSGEGDTSLPDIIISQEELSKKMEDAMKKSGKNENVSGKGEKSKDKNSNKGKGKPGDASGTSPGKKGKPGSKGDSGKKGQSGNKGESGSKGSSGKSGKNGKSGSKGGSGKGSNSNNKNGLGTSNGQSSNSRQNSKPSQSGLKNGKKSNSDNGNAEGNFGDNEDIKGELLDIYRQQSAIRKALQERLNKSNSYNQPDVKRVLDQMEQLELDILTKGYTDKSLSRMRNIKHQLFKIEEASIKQSEDIKRKSDTNLKSYNIPNTQAIEQANKYFNSTEILNKQNLPLQPIYKQKVQSYFRKE